MIPMMIISEIVMIMITKKKMIIDDNDKSESNTNPDNIYNHYINQQ